MFDLFSDYEDIAQYLHASDSLYDTEDIEPDMNYWDVLRAESDSAWASASTKHRTPKQCAWCDGLPQARTAVTPFGNICRDCAEKYPQTLWSARQLADRFGAHFRTNIANVKADIPYIPWYVRNPSDIGADITTKSEYLGLEPGSYYRFDSPTDGDETYSVLYKNTDYYSSGRWVVITRAEFDQRTNNRFKTY